VTVVEQLTLTPQSLRPVQVVENTYVSSSSVKTTIDDPDMVADRPTSVLFTVDAENESTLADDDEVSVTVTQTHADGSTTETTGTMLGETIQRITRSDQPSMTAPVERTFQDAPPDRRPPVFELAGDTESISVCPVRRRRRDRCGSMAWLESAPEAGTDFDIAEMEPLTIGFIAIQAPETTLKEKFEAMGFSLEDIDEDDRDERLPAYGDSDGTISLDDEPDSRTAFESIVEESVDYLRRTYPVPSVEYEVHPDSLKGKTASGFLPDIGTPDGLETDLRTAYDEVSAEFSKRRSTKSSQLSPPTITSTTTGQRAGSTSDRPGHTRRRNFPSHKPRVRSRRARLGTHGGGRRTGNRPSFSRIVRISGRVVDANARRLEFLGRDR